MPLVKCITRARLVDCVFTKAGFPLGDFFRAKRLFSSGKIRANNLSFSTREKRRQNAKSQNVKKENAGNKRQTSPAFEE